MFVRSEARRLAAIVMIDVVDYSRMVGLDEAGTLAALTRLRRDVVDLAAQRHAGRVVKSLGDGFLLEFSSIVDAVRFAVKVQKLAADTQAAMVPERRIVLRLGINIGDVVVQDADLLGDGVNVAARIEKLCPPGGIALSGAAHEQLGNRLPVRFEDAGLHQVKNIDRPVRVHALTAAEIASLDLTDDEVAPPPPSRRVVRLAAVAVVIGAAGAAAGYVVVGSVARQPVAPLRDRLLAVATTELRSSTAKARERLVDDYLGAKGHKAMAVEPKSRGHWWTADWPSSEVAVERLLERCQIAFGDPCAIVAVDDTIEPKPASGARVVRDMPRTHYAGAFDPNRIPGLREATQSRADLVGYATAPGFKAAAFHVRGVVSVVSGAETSRAAQEAVLAKCNGQPATRQDYDGGCLLYAIDNRVVLPERRAEPAVP